MAKDFDVHVEGLKEFRRELREIDRGVLRRVQRTLKEAAEIAAAQAAVLAPRRTGELARSYRAFTRGNIAGVRSPLVYAPVIEYGGTIEPKGTPINIRRYEPVTRAVEREREAIVQRLAEGIDDAAHSVGWR